MVDTFVDYFEDLLASINPTDLSPIMDLMNFRLTDIMREDLDCDFSTMEVKQALDQLSLGKSPGPDGLTITFYRKHWDIIGKEVTDIILGVLNSGLPMDIINATDIPLIPNKKKPETPIDF